MNIQIAILGAESTGKSDLIAALLLLFAARKTESVSAVPEVLRQFCIAHGRAPFAHEQQGILGQQMAVEQLAIEQSTIEQSTIEQSGLERSLNQRTVLLSDCAPITTAIYSEMYFNDPSLIDVATTHHQRYRLSLALAPDIGWHADPLPFMRDGPRAQLDFHWRLLQWLSCSQMPYQLITGSGQSRTQSALDAIIKVIR